MCSLKIQVQPRSNPEGTCLGSRYVAVLWPGVLKQQVQMSSIFIFHIHSCFTVEERLAYISCHIRLPTYFKLHAVHFNNSFVKSPDVRYYDLHIQQCEFCVNFRTS